MAPDELNRTIREAVARDYALGRATAPLCPDVLEVAHGGPRECMRPAGHGGLHDDGTQRWAR